MAKRYQWLGWMDAEWVSEQAEKLRSGEDVWVWNEPASGRGKARPAQITAAFVDKDGEGRIHLDFGPYGRWPDDELPEWMRKEDER